MSFVGLERVGREIKTDGTVFPLETRHGRPFIDFGKVGSQGYRRAVFTAEHVDLITGLFNDRGIGMAHQHLGGLEDAPPIRL